MSGFEGVATLVADDETGRHWSGSVGETGASVRLVWTDASALGVLTFPGFARWITVEDGQIVLDRSPGRGDVALGNDQLFAPEEALPESDEPASAPAADRILQLRIVADYDEYTKFPTTWFPHAQDMVYLAEWLYYAQFGVTWDVAGGYWYYSTPDPYRGAANMCSGTGTQIRLFRDNEETANPVLTSVHEVSVLITGTTFPDAIGCAYVAQIETPWAYTVVSVQRADAYDLKRDTTTLMHEIGHNFGGLHDRAFPGENGPLDVPCWTPNTVQYRYVCVQSGIPQFSDSKGAMNATLTSLNVLKDGGNAQWMRAYSGPRV